MCSVLAVFFFCGGVRADSLLRADFNAGNPWSELSAYSHAAGGAVAASAVLAPVGTIDLAGSSTPSGGLQLDVDNSAAVGSWTAGLSSGRLAVVNHEADLAKLTLAFSLSASLARPVVVRVESFDAGGGRTGGLSGVIRPAAADFFQRFALDLSGMTPFGAGAFDPVAPWVQFSFEIGDAIAGDGWPAPATAELRIDNVAFASPAFYVSPSGNDSVNDGRTAATALLTPQRALDLAQPGDIILVMAGTYQGGLNSVAAFRRAGAPDAWISLKNYPGQQPLFTSTGWNIVSLAAGSSASPSPLILAYLEVRGIHIRGEGDVAAQKYPTALGQADSRTNSNGIAVDGRYMTNVPHHLRFADNLVEYCPAGGIGCLEADWIAIENNVAASNCWTTIYATSGIGVLGASNFDGTVGSYRVLIQGNISHRNETYQKWAALNRYSDGNGIIIDVNQKTSSRPTGAFTGRTLVQNNLSYDNGGSGIHTVSASRVDIVNNTAWLNSASPYLQYSEIFTYGSSDVRITNNILVAPVANLAAGEAAEPVNLSGGVNSNVVFAHNLYFGGNLAPQLGAGDMVGDPRFVNPSRDPTVADFHLKVNSPAIGMGLAADYIPRFDLPGQTRITGALPDAGAFESPAWTSPSPNALARLINLSVLAHFAPGQPVTAGVSTAGGSRALLFRAVGPGLAAFLSNPLPDPGLLLDNSFGTQIDANSNWPDRLAPVFAAVGAFPLGSGSHDAAVLDAIDGLCSAQVTGAGSGMVLVEAYDTQPPAAARLVNLSTRQRLTGGDGSFTAGFVLQGQGPKGVLIRGIGPGLAAFGISDPLSAVRIQLFSGSTVIADNDGWSPLLAPTFAEVGAFALPVRSFDAAIALALAPGPYTVQLSAVGSAIGEGLLEIYELP